MKTENKYAIGIFLGGVSALLLASVAGGLFLGEFYQSRFCEACLVDEGDHLVAKVEAYHRARGKLPESLTDIGEADDGLWYYVQRGSGCYELGYSRGLGSSTVYESRDRTWKDAD